MTERKTTILMVDDDVDSCCFLSGILKRDDYDILEAATGSEALEKAYEKPDIIILDVNLPDIDGLEVCRRIKADPQTSSIPILFLSGSHINDYWKSHGLDLGGDGYLTKPVDAQLLSSTIKSLLRISEAEKNTRQALNFQQQVMDAMPIPVFYKDSEGRYLGCNHAYEEFFGVTKDMLIGKSVYDISPKELADIYHAKDRELFQNPGRQIYDYSVKVAKGALHDVIFHKATFFNMDGSVGGLIGAIVNITEHSQAEAILKVRMKLLEFAATHSTEELLQKTLDEIGQLTGSPIGFYHFVEPDQKRISLQAWSTRTLKEFCASEGKGSHYEIDQAGVWVDCVHQRRPMIHNDYLSLPHRKGLPEGHAAIVRELVVPIMRSDRVVAILGVGNKPTDYTDNDVRIVSSLADVSWEFYTRKQAENALRESETKLQAIFDTVGTGIIIIDKDTQIIIEANQTAVEMTGLPKERMIGQICHSLVCPAQAGKCPVKDLGQTVDHSERKLLCADGHQKDILKTVHPITIKGRDCYVESFIDISDGKRAEEALQNQNKTFSQVLNGMDSLVYVVDMKTYEIVFINTYGQNIWGDAKGKICWQTIQTGQAGPCEYFTNSKLIGPDGNPTAGVVWEFQNTLNKRWYDCRDRAIYWPDGRIVRMEIATDITERKHMELELVQHRNHLEHLVEQRTAELREKQLQLFHAAKLTSLGEMATGMAHEINQPLAAIKLVSQLFHKLYEKKKMTEERILEGLRDIDASIARITRIVDHVRSFARQAQEEFVDVDIHETIGNALALFGEQLRLRSINVIREENTGLPAIQGDPFQLEQVWINVITNARDALEGIGVADKTLVISTKHNDDSGPNPNVEIIFKDNGTGMPASVRDKIFDPFFTSKEAGKGTGLGLSISLSIIKKHNGRIEVESEVGTGTTFRIIFERGRNP